MRAPVTASTGSTGSAGKVGLAFTRLAGSSYHLEINWFCTARILQKARIVPSTSNSADPSRCVSG